MNTDKVNSMISYEKALQRICFYAPEHLDTEVVALTESRGRVLAEDVFSDLNLPPFDKSAMDGYACRKEDLENELAIIETIPAGKQPLHKIGKNECVKIMTGAVVPEGANCVFRQEDARLTGNETVKCLNSNTRLNICYLGEDIRKGDKVLSKHSLLEARHLPVLAGAGKTRISVYKQPVVGVFATGTELVEPEKVPNPYQIRNSNSSQLLGQFADLGIKADYLGIMEDNRKKMHQSLGKALEKYNVILLTGGVSVGEFDLVPALLEENNFEIWIRKTAIQPGKPMIFAENNKNFCFGLSGNPFSSFIQFDLYVKPFIYAFMGYDYIPPVYRFPVLKPVKRKKTDRLWFRPAFIDQNKVNPFEFHGSAHIHSLVKATCLFEIPVGVNEIKENELVNVRFF